MEQLVESIQSLGYHFVLIDCPAGIDVGFINAISPAKEALIVTTPEITSIRWAGALRARLVGGAGGVGVWTAAAWRCCWR
jgi:septum formation inhibitor-activating ATPase MinD